jgi:hypothetical protein
MGNKLGTKKVFQTDFDFLASDTTVNHSEVQLIKPPIALTKPDLSEHFDFDVLQIKAGHIVLS